MMPHAGLSDVGMRREHNEDAMLVAEPMFAVADGVGGSARGEVASQLALDTLATHATRIVHAADCAAAIAAMEQAVLAANAAVHDAQSRDAALQGMATTLTAAVVRPGGEVIVGHVGDSRLYVLSAAGARQATQDHSVVGELLRSGRIDANTAAQHPQRNVITRALGPETDVSVDAFSLLVGPGDWLLACSDGLSEHVADAELVATIVEGGEPIDGSLARLVALANERGGTDNITAVAAQPVPSDVSGELRIEVLSAALDAGAAETVSSMVPAAPSAVEASGELPALQPMAPEEPTTPPWWRHEWIWWTAAGLVLATAIVLTWTQSYFLLERADGRVGINRGFPVWRLSTPYRSSSIAAAELSSADRESYVESKRLLGRAESEKLLDQLAEELDA